MRLKVKSQIHDKEAKKKGILDDCGPAATACAVLWATKGAVDLNVSSFVKEYEKFGRFDKQGVLSEGTTFAQNIKAAQPHGVKGTWPKNWDQVIAAAKAGAAIIVNVQGPKGYPKFTAWAAKHKKKNPTRTYGHYTTVAYDEADGWQWADPTGTGTGNEALGFKITEADVVALASGKGRAKHTTCIIITAKAPAPVKPIAPVDPIVPVVPVVPVDPVMPVPPTKPAKPVMPYRPITATSHRPSWPVPAVIKPQVQPGPSQFSIGIAAIAEFMKFLLKRGK
jgi:hypothetical protein